MHIRNECRWTCYRKSRIAARIALRQMLGKITDRDIQVAKALKGDKEIAAYLVDQNLAGLCADKGLNYHELVVSATLETVY